MILATFATRVESLQGLPVDEKCEPDGGGSRIVSQDFSNFRVIAADGFRLVMLMNIIKSSDATRTRLARSLSLALSVFATLTSASAQSTAFTYQGKLEVAGQPANGIYDFSFSVMDAATGGANIGGSQLTNGVAVSNGLFIVTLNSGAGIFTGAPRWLSILAKTNGAAVYAQLNPRQPITSAPYAIRASDAGTAAGVAAGAVGTAGLASGAVDSSKIADGTITAADLSFPLASNTFWRIGGNAGTTPATHFLGTADGQPLRIQASAVGINTVSPDRPLTIQGTGANSDWLSLKNSGGVTRWHANHLHGGVNMAQTGVSDARLFLAANGNAGLGTTNPLESLHVTGRFLRVDGIGGEQAYLGGDGAGGEVQVGSLSASINKVIMWNGAANRLMDFAAAYSQFSDGLVLGSLTVDAGSTNRSAILPGLAFGGFGSGEGISSQRATNGVNRYGIDFYTSFQKRLSIQNNGRVGIGTSEPEYDFDVNGSAGVRSSILLNTKGVQDPTYPELPGLIFGDINSGEVISSQRGTNGLNRYGIDFYTGFQKRMSITGAGRVDVNTGAGTIQFRSESGLVPGINVANAPAAGVLRFRNSLEIWPDDTGVRSGRLDVRDTSGNATITLNGQNGEATVKVMTITGGADIAEPFAIAESEVAKGSVVVIDDEHPGRLKLSDRAYDTRVAGIVSGANGINPGLALHQEGAIEGGKNVALTGRVYALADASSAPIKPGDLLTTAETPGHLMKASDRERGPGAILGKAMTGLKDGQGLVLVLVSLQ